MATHTINGLALCAGAAGLELGIHIAQPNYRTVCYVEWEAYAAATLVARMEDKALDDAPIWDNLKTFDGRPWNKKIHIITAGYPCQPFSASGKRLGEKDPRHLWPYIKKIIKQTSPPIIFLENVNGHVRLGFYKVARSLRQMGYSIKAGIFTASEMGLPHERQRLFVLAYTNSIQLHRLAYDKTGTPTKANRQQLSTYVDKQHQSLEVDLDIYESGRVVANGKAKEFGYYPPGPLDFRGWKRELRKNVHTQPSIPRGSDGLAYQLDRCRLVGNGVSSLVAAYAFRTLVGRGIAK